MILSSMILRRRPSATSTRCSHLLRSLATDSVSAVVVDYVMCEERDAGGKLGMVYVFFFYGCKRFVFWGIGVTKVFSINPNPARKLI